jgi:hypothetical protein
MGAFSSAAFAVVAFSVLAFSFDTALPPPTEWHAGGGSWGGYEQRYVQFEDDEILALVQAICVSGILEG